jgi:hypothetical protein
VHATIERILEEVFSMWSASCPVLGSGPIDTRSKKRRGVFYVVLSMSSAGQRANRHTFQEEKRCFLCGPFHAQCWVAGQ